MATPMEVLGKAYELFYEKDKAFYGIIHVSAVRANDSNEEDEPHTHSVLRKVRGAKTAIDLIPYLTVVEAEYLMTLLKEESKSAEENEDFELLEVYKKGYVLLKTALELEKRIRVLITKK